MITNTNDISDRHRGSTTNLSDVSSMCPGAVEFYMNQTDPTVYPVRVHCKQALDINRNWIYGQCGGSHSFCLVLIQVPSSTTVRTHIEYLGPAVENSKPALESAALYKATS